MEEGSSSKDTRGPDPLDGLVLRSAVVADRAFIAASWFKSFQKHAPQVGFDVYKDGQGALIDRLLDSSAVVVATVPLDAVEELAGFIVFSPSGLVLHYLYVKQAFRCLGIGGKLLALAPEAKWHTHETHAWRKLAPKPHTRYNPYLLVNP